MPRTALRLVTDTAVTATALDVAPPAEADDDVLDPLALATRQQAIAIMSQATIAPITDAGNAEVFAYMYGDLVRYDHKRHRWLVWDMHRWRPDGNGTVYRMALRAVRLRHDVVANYGNGLNDDQRRALSRWAFSSESRTRVESMLALARNLHPLTDDGTDWDTTPWLLGVPNGVVDLRTGELRDGRPEDRITMQAGVEYDPQARAPRWMRLVREVLRPEDGTEQDAADMAAFLQLLAGFGLTGDPVLHLLIFLMGIGGNGKNTVLNTLASVAGDYSCALEGTAIKSQKYARHSTEVASLAGSRFAYCEEIGDGKLNTDRLKELSGSRIIKARKMREDGDEFLRTWLLWLTTNGLPKTDDDSWGFWRRVIVLDFPHVFNQSDEPDLEDKLEAERQGILTWVVWGAKRFHDQGRVLGTVPASVEEATREYREDIDPLEGFFERGVFVEDADAWTSTVDLHVAYKYAASLAEVPAEYQKSQDGFAKTLSNRRGITRQREFVRSGPRGFKGVRLGTSPDTIKRHPEPAELAGV